MSYYSQFSQSVSPPATASASSSCQARLPHKSDTVGWPPPPALNFWIFWVPPTRDQINSCSSSRVRSAVILISYAALEVFKLQSVESARDRDVGRVRLISDQPAGVAASPHITTEYLSVFLFHITSCYSVLTTFFSRQANGPVRLLKKEAKTR